MKVLVSGSLRGIPDQARQDQMKAASHELGKALAAAGHTLIVGSEDEIDVDPWVVGGFLSDGKTSPVEVHLVKGHPRCYTGKANVKNCVHRYADWDVTVLEVVRSNADAVVVIGGRQGVIQAGIAGWMLGRPTIPFAGFGGGAATVWEYGSSDRARFYFGALTDIEIDELNGPWDTDSTGGTIARQLDRCADFARRASISPRLRLGVSLGILVALVLWVFFLAYPLVAWPDPAAGSAASTAADHQGARFLFLLAAVCSAGAFGALMQSLRSVRDGVVITSSKAMIDAVLGVASGFLTAALYLLAQIALNGKAEPPVDNEKYSRIALIVSMAAVFASLYLDAAFSRFDKFKDSVLSGTYGKKTNDGTGAT